MKYFFITVFIISVCLLTGCQFNDLDKRFFVVAIGIDKSGNKEEPYHVLVKLTIPSAQVQPGKSDFQIISQDSNSIPEALRVIQSLVDKKLDFGHCRVLVINEDLLHQDQLQLMKWFVQRPDVQGIAYVAVGKPSAEEILSWKVKSERLPVNALVLAFNEITNNSPYVTTEILNDYYMRLVEDGIDPYLPIIEPIKGSFQINKSVVFKGREIKAELNRDETRLLNELLNPKKTNIINFGKGKQQFFFHAERTKYDMKIVVPKKGKPYVDVPINIQGFVEESDRSLYRRREIDNFEKNASALINTRIKKFLEHLQKLGVDPLGLELKFQAKSGTSKKAMNEWKSIYPNLEFHVNSKVKLKGTGAMY